MPRDVVSVTDLMQMNWNPSPALEGLNGTTTRRRSRPLLRWSVSGAGAAAAGTCHLEWINWNWGERSSNQRIDTNVWHLNNRHSLKEIISG